jgi:opacity protein-like surface antigen
MKNTTIALITALTVTASAQAGDDYSAKGGKEVIPPPVPACLWTWFAGASAGYVDGEWNDDGNTEKWEEPMYTLHVGVERKCPGSSCSHAIYLEVGYTEYEDSVSYVFGNGIQRNTFSCEIIPITLNYKYECELANRLNWYIGAGAGIALVDCTDTETFTGTASSSSSSSEDDSAFYAHVFAGLVYNVSDTFEVYGGVRYIYMDDVFSGIESPLDGALQYELGGRINF